MAVVSSFLLVVSGVGLLVDISRGRASSLELAGFPIQGQGAWHARTLAAALNLLPVVLGTVVVAAGCLLAGTLVGAVTGASVNE